MAITCYFGSGSPFSWRVMLALEIKGLTYKAVELHFSKGDTKSAAHVARNPRAKVPVLVDGDITIYESTAILAYLERAYPAEPIFGHDNAEAALVWQRTAEIENYLGHAITSVLGPIFRGEIEGRETEIQKDINRLETELDVVEGWLAESFIPCLRLWSGSVPSLPLPSRSALCRCGKNTNISAPSWHRLRRYRGMIAPIRHTGVKQPDRA